MDEETARERLRSCNGLFAGQLSIDEMDAFDWLCQKGMARREYSGAAGLMGIAVVRINPTPSPDHLE